MQMLHPTKTGKMHRRISWRQLTTIVALFILSLVNTAVYAQLAFWNPNNVSGFGPSPWAATSAGANLTVTGLTRGAGVATSQTAASTGWGGNGWGGAANQDATFTIRANTGYQVSYSSFNLTYRRSGTGPSAGTLEYAIGSGAYTVIGSFSFSSTSSSGAAHPAISLTGVAALQNVPATTTIKFRILPTGGQSTGTWYVYAAGLTLNGTVTVAAPACTTVNAGTVNGTGANPACGSVTSTLSLTGATTTGVNYQWQTSADSLAWTNTGSNTNTLNTGSIAATRYYRTIVSCTSGSAADTTLAYKITINPVLVPSVTMVASDDTICAGSPVTFTATPLNEGTAPVYKWIKGTTVVGTNSPAYTDNGLLNDDSVTVMLSSNETCADTTSVASNSIKMVVNPVLTPSVTIAVTPNDTICAGTSVTFTATPVNGGTTPVYEWRKGSAVVGTNSASYTSGSLVSGDSITVSMVSNATCASATPVVSNSIKMVVNPVLTPSVTISANPGNTVCAGTSVTYTAIPVNGGTAPVYQWKKGSAIVGTNNAAYTNSSPATGDSITVSMVSNAACASTTPVVSNSIKMVVNPILTPSVTITVSPKDTICSGASVTFTATPVNGGTAPVYQWKRGSAVVGTNSATYTTNSIANGDTITVSMTSNAPCTGTTPVVSNRIRMTVNPVLVPSVSVAVNPGNTICAGTSVIFTATAGSAGTAPVYQWKKGSTVVGANSPTYTDNALAQGDVITVSVVSNATCAGTTPVVSSGITMTVNPILTPSVTIAPSPNDTICAGTPVTFGVSSVYGGTAPVFQWKKGTSVVGTNSPSYTDNALANGDVITVTMTSNATCASATPVASPAVTMVVRARVVPDVTISTTPSGTVCAGTPVTYTATPVNGGTAPVYSWRSNGIAVGGNIATYINNSPMNNDTVICIMTSNLTCVTKGSDTARVITTVTPVVIPVVSITANPGAIGRAGAPVTYTATVTNGGTTPVYQWKKNRVAVGTNSNAYTNNAWAVNDTVTCTVISNSPCANPDTVVSNLIVMKAATGVGQVNGSGNNISIYPNPNNGSFTLVGTINGNNAVIEVVSMVGQAVYREVIPIGSGNIKQQVNLPASIANGTYLLRLNTNSGTDILRFNIAR